MILENWITRADEKEIPDKIEKEIHEKIRKFRNLLQLKRKLIALLRKTNHFNNNIAEV